MLNLVKSIKLIPLFLFIVFASTATATDAFEEYGRVEYIDKVAKTILLDGRRFLVDGSVMVIYNGTEEHLLNALQEGDIITAVGKRDAMNNQIIETANIVTRLKK